jgi:transcriptional regulator with XRE-family HTH domain
MHAPFMLIATADFHPCVAFLSFRISGSEAQACMSASGASTSNSYRPGHRYIPAILQFLGKDLKLLQKQVADLIGVHEMTITGWEGNATVPEVRYMPAIIQFLGYNPLPAASSLPERIATARRALGLSQRKMAKKLGVDPATLLGWRAGRHYPNERSLHIIGEVLRITWLR